jgi:phosphoglycerate-specific signal transduction histidine kinase
MQVETEIAILKNEFERVSSFFSKIEDSIEKINAYTNQIEKMLVGHENTLSNQKSTNDEIYSMLEKQRKEMLLDVKEINHRISKLHLDVAKDMNSIEKTLTDSLKSIVDSLERRRLEERQMLQDLDKRIRDLEKWRWVVIGGAVVLATFAQQIIGIFIGS